MKRRGTAVRRPAAWTCCAEFLEARALMATFQLPPLQGLNGGANLPKSFERVVGSLQAQLAVQAPRNTAPETLTQVVNEVIDQFESASSTAFAGVPRLTNLLVTQGQATRQAVNALKLQYDHGLINLATFQQDAYLEVQSLTLSRDVWPVGTPLQKYLVLAHETSDDLHAVSTAVQTQTISQEDAAAILRTEALAFQSEVLLATTRQPRVADPVVQATTTLISSVDAAIGQPDFASRIATATAGFDGAMIDTGGAFGPGGSIGRHYQQLPVVPNPLAIEDAATFLNLQYRQIETTSTLVLHRNFTSSSDRYGRFMTTEMFVSPAQAVRRLALDQSWYDTNEAYFVEDVTVPAGARIYVGRVAPIYQGIFRREATPSLYPGMAPQYLVANTYAPGIVWDNFQATAASCIRCRSGGVAEPSMRSSPDSIGAAPKPDTGVAVAARRASHGGIGPRRWQSPGASPVTPRSIALALGDPAAPTALETRTIGRISAA